MLWGILNAFSVNIPATEKHSASRGPMTWLPPNQSQAQSSGQSKTIKENSHILKLLPESSRTPFHNQITEMTPCSWLTWKDNSNSRPSRKEPWGLSNPLLIFSRQANWGLEDTMRSAQGHTGSWWQRKYKDSALLTSNECPFYYTKINALIPSYQRNIYLWLQDSLIVTPLREWTFISLSTESRSCAHVLKITQMRRWHFM